MTLLKNKALSIITSLTNVTSRINPDILFASTVMPLATVLALIFLGDKSISLDEAFSYTIARMDWPEFWQVLAQYEGNQGFYYLLLKFWMVLGDSEFILRLFSAITALFSLVSVYILGKRLFGWRVAIIAALLISVNAFFITYAQEVRGYMLAILLGILSSYFFVRAIEKPGFKWWFAYVLASVLGVYTHVFAIMIPVAQYASLAFMPRRDIPWKGLIISGVAMIPLLIPMGLFVLTRNIGQIGWISTPKLWDIVRTMHRLSGQNGLIPMIAYFIPIATGFFFAARSFLRDRLSLSLWRYVFVFSLIVLPVIILFAVSFVKPVFTPRYFIIFLPFYTFLAAIGIEHFKKRWLIFGAIAVLVFISSFSLWGWYSSDESQEINQNEDWRGVTSYIISNAETGDAIIFYHPMIRLEYEYYINRMETPQNAPVPVHYCYSDEEELNIYYLPPGLTHGHDIPDPDGSILDRLSGYERVWLVLSHGSDRGNINQAQLLGDILQEKYGTVREIEFNLDLRVLLFTRNGTLTDLIILYYKSPPAQSVFNLIPPYP